MGDVWFRFYGRLNDFLPMGRRGCRFHHPVRGRPSVKDVIEGLGVPHPEVSSREGLDEYSRPLNGAFHTMHALQRARRPLNADSIGDRLLPQTRAAFREFHRCPACDRVYWQGSHYERLGRLLERTRERASAQRPVDPD